MARSVQCKSWKTDKLSEGLRVTYCTTPQRRHLAHPPGNGEKRIQGTASPSATNLLGDLNRVNYNIRHPELPYRDNVFIPVNFVFETSRCQALKIITIIIIRLNNNVNCYIIDQLCPVPRKRRLYHHTVRAVPGLRHSTCSRAITMQ